MSTLISPSTHKPFVTDHEKIAELGLVPLLLGIVLGIVFGASSLYLALKVGMTVSASIPVAVLSITLFRAFSKLFGIRKATILENNIVQTTGSAGESIAFGVAVTMPALLILGYEMELGRIMLVAVLGGLLGVLMMIPLRYSLIVKEQKELIYPEGTACAEVLIVGEKGGTSAKTVFGGFFLGLGYKILSAGMKLWGEAVEKTIGFFKGASVATEVSPELLGVGYIIGPRVASIMVAGGVLSSWVLIPVIKLFGDGLTKPLFPATKLISEMGPYDVWRNYVLYIGAGAVAAGGMISLFQSLPTIIGGATAGLKNFKSAGAKVAKRMRTELDLPMPVVLLGSIALVLMIWFAPTLKMNFLGALLIIAFGFLFVTVSSRLTGQIGSSSNPISGMTVATLLLTSLIFLAIGWVGPEYRVTALSVAAIVCIAASNGGTTSQDLKTGYLVGATPRSQQLALLVGALTSALVIGYTLEALNNASTIYSKKNLPAETVVADVTSLTERQRVSGGEGLRDTNLYYVFRLAETPASGPLSKLQPGKYLADDQGKLRYFVDPGINGVLNARDDGTPVQKYEAPKARLMSLIIDGILTQKLPWGLVLLGVSIAIVLELCGIAALPFAVGVYLPLSSSAPIFFGGMIRWLVERRKNGKTEAVGEELDHADTETSPGVLFSSGLIAGGSIAGILLAILMVKEGWGQALDLGSRFPAIAGSQWTAIIAFAGLMTVLFSVGSNSPKLKAKRGKKR